MYSRGKPHLFGQPPVVVMLATSNRTALAQRSAQEQSMLDGFLVKPVTASMLKEAAMQSIATSAGVRKSPRASKPRRLNGNAMASDRQSCLAAGMDYHIGKLFDLTQLVLLLRRYV